MTASVLPGVKNVIAVASGKGGVGKSTVSANLALALAKAGTRVGLLDVDIFGPSIPRILGVQGKPTPEGGRILPAVEKGLKVMSMGFFMSGSDAAIMRGPMLHNVLRQFTTEVDWGDLDYLVMDLPPGTGDVQLSLCQMIPLLGTVIVSTPEDVALEVAQKAVGMCRKLNSPVIGLIENMSHFVCRHCGERDDIFGSGGAKAAAGDLGIPFLGEIPLATKIRTTSGEGRPIVFSEPDSPYARCFIRIADQLAGVIAGRSAEETALHETSFDGRDLWVKWAGGERSVFQGRFLRLQCECAQCRDETTGRRTLREDRVSADVHPVGIDRVGRYGIRIRWSDGHATGIYTFERLRDLSTAASK